MFICKVHSLKVHSELPLSSQLLCVSALLLQTNTVPHRPTAVGVDIYKDFILFSFLRTVICIRKKISWYLQITGRSRKLDCTQ